MGLDISHDAWSGAYSAFGRWRAKIAELAGFPPLGLMEGFYSPISQLYGERWEDRMPLKWEDLHQPDLRLVPLLSHSDCDGELSVNELKEIVPALKSLLPKLQELGDAHGHIRNWHDKTVQFIEGAELAIANDEPLEFH